MKIVMMSQLLKWNVQEKHKDQVMKSFGKKLRELRYNLKKNHYDTHDNYDARIVDRDERVLPDQWKFLIGVWDSDKWKKVRKVKPAGRNKPQLTVRAQKALRGLLRKSVCAPIELLLELRYISSLISIRGVGR